MIIPIKKTQLKFSKKEVCQILKQENYKIETHQILSPPPITIIDLNNDNGCASTEKQLIKKEFAIPLNETFNEKVHKTINIVFKKIMIKRIKNIKKHISNL